MSRAGFHVRAEAAGDRDAVFAVHEAAFGQPGEARLVDALRALLAPTVSLVAVEDDTVVGHVFVSPVTLDREPDARDLGGLAPVGVAPARQGLGAGGALVRAALDASRAAGFRAVFLLGNPAYYARFGFEPALPAGFRYATPEVDASFQCIELEPGALAGRHGRVRYAPAFDALG